MASSQDNLHAVDTDGPDVDVFHDWSTEAFAAFLSNNDEGEDSFEPLTELAPPPEELRHALARLGPKDGERIEEVLDDIADEKPVATTNADRQNLPAQLERIDNPDLAEAYLQDASRGVAEMEQAIIDYESERDPDEALKRVCRELHTLKGASAIAGLSDLARYLHEVEDSLQQTQGSPPSDISERILQCVDSIRRQADFLVNPDKAATTAGDQHRSTSDPSTSVSTHSTSGDSVCVNGSQLDRLMDMLAELVMLRNRRESRVEQLRGINEELARCSSRLREVESHMVAPLRGREAVSPVHSEPIAEVANDLTEIGRTLRESYAPVAEENQAVSSFIRQFRQALVKLLRMPVSGLFRRLQRAALDAARVEGKRVRLEVVGSSTGLERSVQERLFEPLLHIIRNAVSHGIEPAVERERAGKDPVGTITLEATGAPNLLVISVRDDGQGLDYEALRRRGIELGLLTGDRNATPHELAQLIFRPGFSTRTTANEVAGRGIGMDVVANTLDRMHSWVEVESAPGKGTNVRLTVPLRSIIEHVMVFRTGEQLFAVPMQYIKSAGESAAQPGVVHSINALLGVNSSPSATPTTNLLIEAQPLSTNNSGSADPTFTRPKNAESRLLVQVDEIVGPEEVVVRPLPPLFRHQSLFAGVTLSGNGNIVLVLDPRRLVNLAGETHGAASYRDGPSMPSTRRKPRILVVDDSLSARRAVSLLLEKRGWATVEVADGAAAVDQLESEEFAAMFTDFDMPRMDGLQLVNVVRRTPTLQHLPVIMLSSRCGEELEAKAISQGASCYFRKPITDNQLDEILTTLVFNSTPGEATHAS